MNSELQYFLTYGRELAIGLVCFVFSLVVIMYLGRRVVFYGALLAKRDTKRERFNWVMVWFFLVILGLALSHLVSILLWSIELRAFGLFDSLVDALLFAGSCYTTVGFIPDNLPSGWKMLALFISLSGLFSLALSTAAVISMGPDYRRAWHLKRRKHVQSMLDRYGLEWKDLD